MPLKVIVPAVVLLGGFMVCTSSMYGTPEYARKEKKACTTCHVKVVSDKTDMGKNLTSTGTCYREHDHSLLKCEIPQK
jgi:ferredoxin